MEAEVVKTKIIQQTTSQVIINGIPREEKQTFIQISCPKCRRILASLPVNVNNGLDVAAINRWIRTNKEDLVYKFGQYCQECGQKLSYDKEEVYDLETQTLY